MGNATGARAILAFSAQKQDPISQAGARELPSPRYRLLVYFVCVSLIGLEIRAIWGPFEDWPFTSAPMFARYHRAEEPTYRVVFQVEFENGSVEILDPALSLGLGELSIKRLFFGTYYGSTDPRHPLGHHPNDNPHAFSARLREFSERCLNVYSRRTQRKPQALRIEVSEYRNGRLTRQKLVSRYEARTRTLSRLRSEAP